MNEHLLEVGWNDAIADRPRVSWAPAYMKGYDAGLSMRYPITDYQKKLNARRRGVARPWAVV